MSAMTVSPNSSLSVGWGWMNSATSNSVAAQLTAREACAGLLGWGPEEMPAPWVVG